MPYYVHSDPNADDGHWRDEGMRECARAERCSDPRFETVDGTIVRAPALTPRSFCDSCSDGIQRSTRELPDLWRRAHAEIGSRNQSFGPRVATSKTPPLPISLAVDELCRDIVYVLTSWEERVCVVAGLHVPDTRESRRRDDYTAVKRASATLATHINVLLSLTEEPMRRAVSLREAANLPQGTFGLVHKTAAYADVLTHLSGVHAGLEILQLHFRCRRLLGDANQPARHLPTPCGVCGFTELYEALDVNGVHDGAKCRHCREEYSAESYSDLAKDQGDTLARAGVSMYRPVGSGRLDDLVTRRA